MSVLLMTMLVSSYLVSLVIFWLSFGSVQEFVVMSLGRVALIGMPILRLARTMSRFRYKKPKKKAQSTVAPLDGIKAESLQLGPNISPKRDSWVRPEQ